jgi:hypothetical protein
MLTYGKEEPRDFHPIIHDWGGAWAVPRLGEGVPEPEHGHSEM